MKDKNKEVQKTACIALADICDESFDRITPYSETILFIFADAFKYFQKKNLQILMNAIGILICFYLKRRKGGSPMRE